MLDGDEIGADERNMIHLPKGTDNPAMINSRNQDGKEIGQEGGLFLEVE